MKNLFTLFLFLLLLFGDIIVIYWSLYNPYAAFFIQHDQPWNLPTNHPASMFIMLSIIIINVVLSILFFTYLSNKPRLIYIAPVVTLLSLALLFVTRMLTPDYPSSNSSFTDEDGYHYKTEIWWGRADGQRIYKHWKSTRPYLSATDEDSIHYHLDSMSVTKE